MTIETIMNYAIKEIAEKLVGRPLTKEDGIDGLLIERTENRLGLTFPKALKEFYSTVGNMEMFMSSFERFIALDELECEDNKLIFLDENQSVCCWGVNISDGENPTVYMCTSIENEGTKWFSEEVALDEFLRIIMYLQCAEGGYEFGVAVYEDDFENRKSYEEFLAQTTSGWTKEVDHNGFVAYQKDDKLIWYFLDSDRIIEDIIYASTLTEKGMVALQRLGFSEL